MKYTMEKKAEALARMAEIGVQKTSEEMNISVQTLYKWRNEERDGAEASRDYIYALMNYTDKVGYDCEVWKSGEVEPYYIVNITNVGERNRYTELQLRRVIQHG